MENPARQLDQARQALAAAEVAIAAFTDQVHELARVRAENDRLTGALEERDRALATVEAAFEDVRRHPGNYDVLRGSLLGQLIGPTVRVTHLRTDLYASARRRRRHAA
jgi:hypothetical protein